VAIAASILITAQRLRQVIADFDAGPKSGWRKYGRYGPCAHFDLLEPRLWTGPPINLGVPDDSEEFPRMRDCLMKAKTFGCFHWILGGQILR
jgi:hypothetical protein